MSALYTAVEDGNFELAKLLLEFGADINFAAPASGSEGGTPLVCSAILGHTALSKLLSDHGAEMETPDNEGMTALYWAASQGRKKIVEILVEKGANIGTHVDSEQSIGTALICAAGAGE